MRKRFLPLLIVLLLLSACAKKQPAQEQPHYSITRQDMQITLDAPAAPVLAALGAPFGYSECQSSSRKGVEKTYRFSGLNLRTYQGRDCDRILGILFTDDSLQTEEGIRLGSTAQQVRECYGENAIQDGRCILCQGQDRLILLLKNNAVTAIQYLLPPGKRQ